MAVRLNVQVPNAPTVFKGLGRAGAAAMTLAMNEVVEGWKREIRALVRQNFRRTPTQARSKGLNFEKSFQGDTYPPKKRRRVSFNPAGFLNAKADYAGVFEDGDTVASGRQRKYMAIAMPAAKKLGLDYGLRQTGGGFRYSKASGVEAAEQRYGALRILPSKNGNKILAASVRAGGSLLGGKRGAKTRGKKRDFIPLFVLVKRVKLPRKLRFVPIARRWLYRLPHIVERIAADLMAKKSTTITKGEAP